MTPETSSLDDMVRAVAHQVGETVGDLSSEHERWRIYCRALEVPSAWDLLLAAVHFEPDGNVAASVVVRLMEQVPAGRRLEAIRAMSPGHGHDFAVARARELGILVELGSGRYQLDPDTGISTWSTWLQLRAVHRAADERILAALASDGRTRRVRGQAARRLRAVAKAAGAGG